MGFAVRFRELLDPGTEQEFSAFMNFLRQFLLREHNEDGTHLPNATTFPVGSMVSYGGTSAPSGWLLCDGTAVSRATYKSLLDVIGTAYGIGDGNTTFNLPDLRQRVPLGKAASGTGATLGSTGGTIDHVHTGPSHTHSISSQAAHTHGLSTLSDGVTATSTAGGSGVTAGADFNASVAGHAHFTVSPASGTHTSDTGGSHDHGGATGSAGTGNTGSANPPYQVVNFIIFTGVE
jgi:microcystin-dependent protein